MTNYFVRNLETEKIELYFDKATYQALPEDLKTGIKSNCLFSKYKSAWISRAKIGNTWRLDSVITKLNLQDGGTIGENLAFADKVEIQQERAADRVERFEDRAEKNATLSTQAYQRAHTLGSVIPMGQPILVGHHSERGHRSLLNKIDNAMRTSCEADDKAAYYADRAKTAERTATGAKFEDAGYLVNRIKECNASLGIIERRLQGKMYYYSEATPISEQDVKHWNERKAEETEKLNFYTDKLKALQEVKTVWSKETLTGKTEVNIKGRWRKLVKCNPTTIGVENNCFDDPELAKKYALKYNYGEVRDAR